MVVHHNYRASGLIRVNHSRKEGIKIKFVLRYDSRSLLTYWSRTGARIVEGKKFRARCTCSRRQTVRLTFFTFNDMIELTKL